VAIEVREFWRVGYYADPLHVTLEYQNGSGRFDDPERKKVVLYGAYSLRTCFFEIVMPWDPADDGYVNNIPYELDPQDSHDDELRKAIVEDAKRDQVIAARRRQLPQTLYDKAKVQARLENGAMSADLNSPGTRMQLASAIPYVKTSLAELSLRPEQFDKSLLTSQHLDITRSLAGFLMRSEIDGIRHDGLICDSRHDGTNVVLFEGRYEIRDYSAPNRLTREDPDVQAIAEELDWDP
jgi:hypothetical protein